MSESESNETNSENQEQEGSLGCGCLIIILVLALVIFAFNSCIRHAKEHNNLSSKTDSTTQKATEDKVSKKEEFAIFQEDLIKITAKCDSDYSKATKALEQNDTINAFIYFDNASYNCGDAFLKIQSIKKPKGLTGSQNEQLQSALTNLQSAYSKKRVAAKNLKKAIDKNSLSALASAKESINQYEKYLLLGSLQIKAIEKEINGSANQ